MQRHGESHFDHGLTEPQIAFLLDRFADKGAFFIESVELPEHLGTVPCGLHGPATGGEPVPEAEVTYQARGTRAWPSRLCQRLTKPTRLVTVIAGPHDEEHVCGFCCNASGRHVWGAVGACPHCKAGKIVIHHDCILYTAFGGPLAPKEPGDPSLDDKGRAESQAFWAEHALSV